jgi:anti-sigma factor RsiW
VNCSACEARLSARVDGDLPLAEAQAVDAHLSTCAACRALAQDLRTVEVKLEGLPGIEPRADFTSSVMAAVAALPAPKPARIRWRWFVGYLAAAWALLIGLTAARVIDWRHAFAAAATELGKMGAAGSTLADVAGRLHLPMFAAGAVGMEVLVIAVGAFMLRRYLPRVTGWIAGAQAI